jgi:hypothetical protein
MTTTTAASAAGFQGAATPPPSGRRSKVGRPWRPVESYDPATGATVRRYESVTAAAADGFHTSSVVAVARGLQKIHKGLGWRYTRRPMSAAGRANIAASNRLRTGRTHTPEARARMSASKKGRKLGPPSAEHRAKISAALKGRTLTPETRAKMSAVRKGRPHSPEHRANMIAGLAHRRRPVESYDPATGATVRRYESRKEAAADGFDLSGISMARRGKQKTHGGLGWRDAT